MLAGEGQCVCGGLGDEVGAGIASAAAPASVSPSAPRKALMELEKEGWEGGKSREGKR